MCRYRRPVPDEAPSWGENSDIPSLVFINIMKNYLSNKNLKKSRRLDLLIYLLLDRRIYIFIPPVNRNGHIFVTEHS